MINIKEYAIPETSKEAYEILNKKKNNVILGGCAFLRMGSKQINTAIDLSKLNLNYINENDRSIDIGAMTTFRDIETSHVLQKYFNSVLPKSVENIVGVQLRNIVTVGGTVYSKYGFSDFITALLSLNAEVLLYNQGEISLEKYLKQDFKRDILIKISIPKSNRRAAFKMMRNSKSDYAILNVAVSREEDDWKIVVGARPQKAQIAKEASKFLSESNKTNEEIQYAAELATKELVFGSNMRASREYREAICTVLIKRAVMEVL